jgi:hypothetical protein
MITYVRCVNGGVSWDVGSVFTQNSCSHTKFGCRDHAQKPLVMNPRLASSGVHWRLDPIHAFSSGFPVALYLWKDWCWLSAVNSIALVTSPRPKRT